LDLSLETAWALTALASKKAATSFKEEFSLFCMETSLGSDLTDGVAVLGERERDEVLEGSKKFDAEYDDRTLGDLTFVKESVMFGVGLKCSSRSLTQRARRSSS